MGIDSQFARTPLKAAMKPLHSWVVRRRQWGRARRNRKEAGRAGMANMPTSTSCLWSLDKPAADRLSDGRDRFAANA